MCMNSCHDVNDLVFMYNIGGWGARLVSYGELGVQKVTEASFSTLIVVCVPYFLDSKFIFLSLSSMRAVINPNRI